MDPDRVHQPHEDADPSEDSPGRVLAVGDIHGCALALDVLLDAVSPSPADTLVILGDVVDRGPASRLAVERLLEATGECSVELILGNHEEMMLATLDHGDDVAGWLGFGGRETLISYGGEIDQVPESHIEFLRGGRPYWETETEIFIHANLEPGVPLSEQAAEWLRWTHLSGDERPHESGKRVICGHTPQPSGLPLVLDGWVCLDTACFAGGYLTCLELGRDTIWQAGEDGTIRSGVTLTDLR